MIEELKVLKSLRDQVEALKITDQNLANDYYATEAFQKYAANHEQLDNLKSQVTELENSIRDMAVQASRETGFVERKFGLVTIKEFTKVIINDTKQAIAWISLNAPACLSITKEFDKVAKSLQLPFVTVEKEFRAQIASDLSELENGQQESS